MSATFSHIQNGDTGLVARTNINDGFDSVITEIGSKTFITLTDAATISWDYSTGYNAKVTLSGTNRSLSITGATNGDYGTLFITQDSVTASTILFGANDKFASATYSFSGTASTDIFTFVYDGTDYYWNYNQDFS